MPPSLHTAGVGRANGSTAVRQSSLRSANLATVLQRIYAAPEAPSRADVAAATGLTRSTVSRLVDELIAHGLVREHDRVFDGQRGRPAVPLGPQGLTWVGLGLEINVWHAAARLVDLAGTVLGEVSLERDLRGADPDATIREVAALGAELVAHAPESVSLAGVHLALPGLVDVDDGLLLRAPNLEWRDLRPGPLLREVLGDVPVAVGNEADYAAVTMAWTAPGRPSERGDFLYISGEVGIGSALVAGGEVRTGRHGWAGEIGHVCVDPEGPVCGCGARGCLEVYLGQESLRRAAGAATTEALVERLASEEPTARAVVSAAGRRLGIVLAGALNLLDVSDVVLGGHLGRVADHLVPEVLAELNARVVAAAFVAPHVSTMVDDTEMAALGAAYSALADVIIDPASWMEATTPTP